MNLIEQLGGYERAKNIRLGNEEDWMFYSLKKDWYSDIKHDESFIFIDDLKCHLIQYRREHNIFEKGDKIIFLAPCNSVINYDSCLEMFTSHGLIRHATPAEIAAGKRLN